MKLRIRELREDHDKTQSEIAQILCVAQTTYSDYENGRLNLPLPLLVQLAQYWKTSLDYLAGLTDDPRPYPRAAQR